MEVVNVPDKLTRAERKLAGVCISCNNLGFIEVIIPGQVSDYPYKQPCSCEPGKVWQRKNINGLYYGL